MTARAVLTPADWEDHPASLWPYGNGAQFQYPIFQTRKEAQTWKNEAKWERGKIVRVEIKVSE